MPETWEEMSATLWWFWVNGFLCGCAVSYCARLIYVEWRTRREARRVTFWNAYRQ